jgi:1-acylglycerone phosphate reductase
MPKYAVITGCSAGGIGDAIAQAFHKQGVHVFATARSLDKIRHLKEMGMSTLQLDVLSSSSIASALSAIDATTNGKLDFLANNSGRGKT